MNLLNKLFVSSVCLVASFAMAQTNTPTTPSGNGSASKPDSLAIVKAVAANQPPPYCVQALKDQLAQANAANNSEPLQEMVDLAVQPECAGWLMLTSKQLKLAKRRC